MPSRVNSGKNGGEPSGHELTTSIRVAETFLDDRRLPFWQSHPAGPGREWIRGAGSSCPALRVCESSLSVIPAHAGIHCCITAWVPTSVHLAPSDRSRGHLQEAVLSPDFFAFPDFRYTCALIIVSFFRSCIVISIPATPFSSRGPARFCHRSPPCPHESTEPVHFYFWMSRCASVEKTVNLHTLV